MSSDPQVLIDDKYYATIDEMVRFKESRGWREVKSWLTARRETLADMMDEAADDEFKLLRNERRVLRDLLELPELIISQLELQGHNEEKDEENDDANTE